MKKKKKSATETKIDGKECDTQNNDNDNNGDKEIIDENNENENN